MNELINVYCDESCHLPHDNSPIMVIGGISCPAWKVKEISEQLFRIKKKYGVYKFAEAKWIKVSPSKLDMYKDMVDLFFSEADLKFRAVIATGKQNLSLDAFGLDYDDWYQRIYYLLLREMVSVGNEYAIYNDIKDTKGNRKVEILKDVLNRSLYSFYDETICRIQLVRSDQIQIFQLVDLLIGAVAYTNRGLTTSLAKVELARYIEEKSRRPLLYTTPRYEEKFNLFRWVPQEKRL